MKINTLTANSDGREVQFCHRKFRVFKPRDDHVLSPVHECIHREIDGEDQASHEDNEPENPAKQQNIFTGDINCHR